MDNVSLPRYFDIIFSMTKHILSSNSVVGYLSESLEKSDAIYLIASGRSYSIPLSVLRSYNEEMASKEKPKWKYVGGIESYPVGRPRDILKIPNLDHLLVLAISGSGNTPVVIESLEDIGILSSNASYVFVTGNLYGKLYKIGDINSIPTILIPYNNRGYSSHDFGREGIMGDVFELSSALLLYFSIFNSKSNNEFYKKLKQGIISIESVTEELVDSLVKNNTVVGGFGVGSYSAEAFATRLKHLSAYTNREVSLVGPLAHLSYGDNLLLITFSGINNPFIKAWIEKAGRRKANIYVITSKNIEARNLYNTHYSNIHIIPLASDRKSEFYTLVNFYLNYVVFRIVGKLQEVGAKLSGDILKWYHSVLA